MYSTTYTKRKVKKKRWKGRKRWRRRRIGREELGSRIIVFSQSSSNQCRCDCRRPALPCPLAKEGIQLYGQIAAYEPHKRVQHTKIAYLRWNSGCDVAIFPVSFCTRAPLGRLNFQLLARFHGDWSKSVLISHLRMVHASATYLLWNLCGFHNGTLICATTMCCVVKAAGKMGHTNTHHTHFDILCLYIAS